MDTAHQLQASLTDRYRIERELGAGGMATVYLAHDLRHDRRVAIKVLKPELAAVLGAERFIVEIKTTAALQHPHILPLFDSGTADGLLFYVMPYIEGETIRERLNRETQFSIDEAIRITREVADALDYAHRHGVIHRDIKPENILLHDGRAMVMDFGIALAVSAAAGGRMTETGLSLGTPHYMSPEQATAEKEITGRSDVYSLASVLYEMLAGQPPHVGGAAQQVIMRIITEAARPVSALRRNVPPNVVSAIARALEKVPADRFDSAKAFSDALANGAFTHLTTAEASTTAPRDVSRSGVRRREAAAWATAVVALAGFAWSATRQAPVETPGRFVMQMPDSVSIGPVGNSYGRLAMSRDGSRFVFVGQRDGSRITMLYLRSAGDPVATPIRGTENGRSPCFAPDGGTIAFNSGGSLRRVPITGGTPQTLSDAKDASFCSWGDDGRIVYQTGGGRAPLKVVPASGGDSKVLAAPDTAHFVFQLRQPEILPGNAYALVAVIRGARSANAAPDSVRLATVSLKDGSVTDLDMPGGEPHYVAPGYVLFNRGPVVMAAPFSLGRRAFTGPAFRVLEDVAGANPATADFAVSQNGWLAYQDGGANGGASTVYLVDQRGAAHQLETEGKNLLSPAISPDGKQVAFQLQTGRASDIWTYDVATGALRPLTTGGSAASSPKWSRDGSWIYYAKTAAILAARASSGVGAETTLVTAGRIAEFAPGPPHGYSLFRTGAPDRDLYLARTESLSVVRPFVITPGSEVVAEISPNGRWAAYMSDASGRYEVVVRALPGPGPEVQVSLGGGEHPRWSGDGRTLFYRGARNMMAAHVTDAAPFTVTKRDTLFVDTYAHGAGNEFAVFPNGREFLMLRRADSQAQMYMMINWQGLVGRATPGPATP